MIPRSFQKPPFYEVSSIEVDEEASVKERLRTVHFYYDMTKEISPWEDPNAYLPILFSVWKEIAVKLRPLYQQRQTKEVYPSMLLMSALAIDALFWMNKKNVPGLDDVAHEVKTLPYQPPNSGERLAFVLNRVEAYPSFIQLHSFMQELEKLHARIKTIEKKHQHESSN